jgi:ATP-binding cassette, subfamily B, bacterial
MKKEEKKDIQWRSIMRHYWQFLRKWPFSHVIMGLGVLTGAVVYAGIVPYALKMMTDLLAANKTETTLSDLQFWFFVFLGCVLLYWVMARAHAFTLAYSQSAILRDLANEVFETLSQKSYAFFSNTFTGSLVAKSKRYANAFETLHDMVTWNLSEMILSLVIGFFVLSFLSWQLGVIFLVWLVMYAFVSVFMVRWVIPKRLISAEADSKVTGAFSDAFTNILAIKMFAAEQKEMETFRSITEDRRKKQLASWLQAGFFNDGIQGFFADVFQVGLLSVTLWLWWTGSVTAGMVVLVVIYARQQANFVFNISRQFTRIVEAVSDAQEMIDILDAPNDIVDPAHPQPLIVKEGRVSFRDITHGYEDGNALFEHFSLDIAGGEKVAFVGKSGSGKTTLTKLLLRFIDVREGRVLIDDTDVREVTQADLRMHIAYVPQEPMLFHRSLFENIAYGKQDATLEEVKEVARRARASDFIEALPQGYDTLVGERGVKLSGGERQRVAIARALLKDAPIVVLDEATSALDSEAEEAIQQAFDELMKGRTTIVIAHRLSTIAHMDRIVVLDGGRIVEQGTHAELIARGGAYAELWNKQVGGFLRE